MHAAILFVLIYFAFDRLAAGASACLLLCLPLLARFAGLDLTFANGSIWPGALLHGIVQGAIKLLVDDDAAFQTLAIAWVALGIAAPWLFFLLRPRN
jgi:hypothetical protein